MWLWLDNFGGNTDDDDYDDDDGTDGDGKINDTTGNDILVVFSKGCIMLIDVNIRYALVFKCSIVYIIYDCILHFQHQK